MRNNESTVKQLKESLDIVAIAEMYGELIKSGANYRYKDDKSITINASKQIFSDFNGNIIGGSVLDLIMYMEKKDLKAGIERLKELSSLDTYTVDSALQIKRKEKADIEKTIDFKKLTYYAQLELNETNFLNRPIKVIEKDTDKLLHFMLSSELQKLFEAKTLPAEYADKINYMFNYIIGWNKYFQCPSIILKDDTGKIVDLIAYRPKKPDSYDNWSNPKYIYKNSHNRGENFLYPFRKEVQAIINREKYLIIGEGIKNGLNSLLYSVPFITLESSSNKISNRLLDYIKKYHSKGFNLICMFDGDPAGYKAYSNFISQLKLDVENFLDFNSGLDFVDYLQSEDK